MPCAEFSAEVIIEDLRKMPSFLVPHAQETRSISAAVAWGDPPKREDTEEKMRDEVAPPRTEPGDKQSGIGLAGW